MKIIAKIFTVALLLIATFVAQAQRPRVWTVTNAGDGAAGTLGGAGTLRNIIAGANSGDEIIFSPSIDNIPIILSSSLYVNTSVKITGNGHKKTVIRLNDSTANTLVVANSVSINLGFLTLSGGDACLDNLGDNNITLAGAVFENSVYINNPVRFNILQCEFQGNKPLRVENMGLSAPSNVPYKISASKFRCKNANVWVHGALEINGTPINPIASTILVEDCDFRDNIGTSSALSILAPACTLNLNRCTIENNTALPTTTNAIISLNVNTFNSMNNYIRGNVNRDVSLMRIDANVNLNQNLITGNSSANIEILTSSNTIQIRNNTIANNNTAVIKGNNLQVANSYLEATFNTVNTPVSLGGNYFRNAVAWAASSDIFYTLVSFPATQAPIFVAPVTSIPSTGGNYRLATNSILIGSAINNQVPQDIFDYDGDGNTTEMVPLDIVGNPRRFDRGVDIGAYERQLNGGGLRAENTEETLTNNPQTVVYPNPANEVLNINYELSTGAEKAEVAIFNTIGQVVYQTTVNAESKALKIDVSNFDKGLYVIKIVDNQGNAQNQKVLVQ